MLSLRAGENPLGGRQNGICYDSRLCSIIYVVLLGGMLQAQWPLPSKGSDAYEFVESRRKTAKTVAEILETLQFLEQPLVHDPAGGHLPLATRLINVQFDLAVAYAKVGEAAKSVQVLQQMARTRPDAGFTKVLNEIPEFAPLRERADFRDAQSTREYYQHLMALCARRQDGHTNVYAPQQLNIHARPPVSLTLRSVSGDESTVSFARCGYTDVKPRPGCALERRRE